MKISLKWINEYVDVADFLQKPEALSNLLTNAGLEVEEIHFTGRDLKHVVIGLILEKDQHPDAEKLSVCKVSTGEGVVHQIVCGAKNHKAEDRVIVALPGAVLPGNFAIKKSVLRGVESGGMLCSLKELGFADTSDGIEILPKDAPLGTAYADWAGLDDVVFEIKVTPNRADCLSHLGLAREIACLTGRPIQRPEVKFSESAIATSKLVNLDVIDKEMCPRYTGRAIKGVKVGESPDWLKRKLDSVGQSSINNVVDITNYVMLEMGQPLHAFDLAKIEGQKVRIACATAGEKFVTLDGTELTLVGEELMIQSATRSMCMAGTIGGKDSGVSQSTQDIFLEAAYFTPQFVRKAARKHGLNTESSYRFSRGVDPKATREALDRAAQLIQQVAGGEICSEPIEVLSREFKTPVIHITSKLISDRLGYEVDEAKLESYLLRLGCEVQKANGEYIVKAPSWRVDIEIDMDLVEEYARLNGYEHIPETLPAFASSPSLHDAKYTRPLKVKEVLQGQGFHEAINFGFVSGEKQNELLSEAAMRACGLSFTAEDVRIINPLADQINTMRKSLFLGLLENMNHNFHHGVGSGSLYEVGQVFHKDSEKFSESQRLGLITWGHKDALWKDQAAPAVFRIKSALESVLKSLHISSYQFIKFESNAVPSFLHRGQMALIKVEGKVIGYMGSLHPKMLDEMKIRGEVAFAELDLEALLKGKEKSYRVSGVSKFPMVERDMAFVMPAAMEAQEVIKVIRKTVGEVLRSVEVFDVFTGESLGQGQKSVAFRMVLQNPDQTLTEELISEKFNATIAAVCSIDGVQVR